MEKKPPERILCPLVDEEIEAIDCIENRDCIDGIMKISSLPERFKQKENFRDICEHCPWHNY